MQSLKVLEQLHCLQIMHQSTAPATILRTKIPRVKDQLVRSKIVLHFRLFDSPNGKFQDEITRTRPRGSLMISAFVKIAIFGSLACLAVLTSNEIVEQKGPNNYD